MVSPQKLSELRTIITENLRVQKDSSSMNYVDMGHTVGDILARQNHTIFGRRGCGKTLLLHYASTQLPPDRCVIYLNCENFKQHSFPNVLIEILIALVKSLKRNARGWFGRKRRIGELLDEIECGLSDMQVSPDNVEENVEAIDEYKNEDRASLESGISSTEWQLKTIFGTISTKLGRLKREYREKREKIESLNLFLPRFKENLSEFFELSTKVKCAFIQIDDLYHLKRSDQAFVIDYIHRLCKDLPLYFKVATLRHNSMLYMDSFGQPIGAQERHDYQPIDVDYSFNNFKMTENQNRKILEEFGRMAGLGSGEIATLFKGEGFSRLVMAGGGVPRDVLSLFLQALSEVSQEEDQRIGKDNVRILSREVFERRIEELKQDCKPQEQDELLRGIYVIRHFCSEKGTNIFLVRERDLQRVDEFQALIYRLLDYRIIHSCANALTHKSSEGTFQAFAVDIGSYAFLRKLKGRFNEIDVSESSAREKMRSAPILEIKSFVDYAEKAPKESAELENKLLEDDDP